MAAKNVYKEYYFYLHPLSESVANRTMRYRRKREQGLEQVELGLNLVGDCFEPSNDVSNVNNVLSGDGMFGSNDSNDFVCGQQLIDAYGNLQPFPASSPSSVSPLASFVEQRVEEHL